MEHAQPVPAPFPWRATTAVAGAVALVELIALVAIGLAHFAPHATRAAQPMTRTHHAAKPAPVKVHAKPVPQVPLRPRSHVRVLVLNGNGVSGAAAAEAARLQGDGYRIGGATNAQRHNYARSMVMFVPGWAKEARRLAKDAGVRMVSPVDGLRSAQLRGSKVILLLGT